jgi:hypothetical protein
MRLYSAPKNVRHVQPHGRAWCLDRFRVRTAAVPLFKLSHDSDALARHRDRVANGSVPPLEGMSNTRISCAARFT